MNRAKREITLEHLASMRSGLACGLSAPGEPELIAMMQSSDWVDLTLDLPMSYTPGRRFAYSALDLVVVTTAAGFEPGLLVPFLYRAIRGEKALPENQSLFHQLEEALAAARSEPKAVLTALPELAGHVSGRTYEMEANPLGFERLCFDFTY
ncbi:hypothetical protein [Desulfosarcina variabilis]|uniref:hypothetical protein n=1 Tax=Desulfosarcina variabilis TaxID=2300 RepID=UPI003AFA185F